jgi:hypothetical protein
MTIQLPIGSEAGSYDVEIRKSGKAVTAAAAGQANIEGGITRLMVEIDTSSVPSGEYELAWRMHNFDWRFSPILLR